MRSRPLVLVALLPLLGACHGREQETAERSAPTGSLWHSLGTWSGRGNRQTESFDVTTGALRLAWEAKNESAPGEGRLRVSLYSAISGRPLQTIVDTEGTGTDTVHFADDPRVTYLLIESEQMDWRLTLEEELPGDPGAASGRK